MNQSEPGLQERLETFLQRALVLDLEVSPRGKILKIGALLGDQILVRSGDFDVDEATHELSNLTQAARGVLGHNLLRHDLRVLRETHPRHPLLKLPVIDTLVLSPIAFPENPYHRLVKDYKLVSESVNDPLADARQAASLFRDEFRSLDGLRQTEPGLFDLLHFLLATPEGPVDPAAIGLGLVFAALGATLPSPDRAAVLCRELLARWACGSVPVDEGWLQTSQPRLALAYVVTWLRVAGSNSVLPPWVRLEHPLVRRLIQRLRETPCGSETCVYCRRTHNACAQLQAFFGWDNFRPLPRNPSGGSLQQDIIEAGLRNESLLAILPTGGGKSLGYQLPALVRNYRRGVLTLVISPLQALMKDQVDGLVRRTGTAFAAALYGLLTPPERGDVLRRIRLGDAALLYVSPEQLRNRSFREAIAQREIGCWVFDEAHCLSKWGHDFRPDYLYAGRFIREFSKAQGTAIPPIAAFTATAKREVKDEIIHFFKTETGRELALYEGGVERDNLQFEVQTITGHSKLERVHDLLATHLPRGEGGSAIVFRATRMATQETAEYLAAKGWPAAHFHAGLTPPEKKRIQDEFLAGTIQVICATNAFGMGIDKENVRLVIHADTPGSLENYLQEAGRAGRDGRRAECILLYDEEDCERQFHVGALSELSRHDIAQILRGLRKATRGDRHEVIITTGEILRDEDVETDIDVADTDADTKVRTAVSWLERSGFIERDENVTSVFQARLLVRNLPEAEAKMAALRLSLSEQALWLAILREFMNASSTDSLTVDRLAMLPEFVSYAQNGPELSPRDDRLREKSSAYRTAARPEYISAKVLKILRSMTQAGLMKRDLLLNAFVWHKVADHSRRRLDRVLETDRKLVDLLALEEPDPEGWLPLSLSLLNQRLTDENVPSSTELLRQLLKSLSEDGRGFAGTHGSLDLRHVTRDLYRVRVRRTWTAVSELAEKRRRVASLVLDTLLAKIPAHTPPGAELLVEFSFEELHHAIDRDLLLRSELKDIEAAIERALMYLHEQHVIVLQQGLAVFRSAMTIRLRPEAKGQKYQVSDYAPLQHHYRERIFQVHVMSEYARLGLARIREALGLVLAYFTWEKGDFIRRFLGAKPELLEQATTARSFQRIVSDLANQAQIKLVTAPLDRNLLILAGPGSGKTRTVVHRCAYLLRVERIRPQSVLVCCFNRQAAIELRRRLNDLAEPEARGVLVLTYHSLALRLLGYSYAGQARTAKVTRDFEALITDAIALLRGEKSLPGIEANEVRDRLLAGFQHILVDEYQDIDEPQYELISALAGRKLEDPDLRLTILAVGDDDQSIYGFRGANIEFIRRFQRDYQAEVHYLVENYRATRHLIDASNQLIAANTDRMKTQQPIRINRHRQQQPPGGEFGARDDFAQGRVQLVQVQDNTCLAHAVLAEIRRLRALGATAWSSFAVLSRTHRELAQVRTLAERENFPIRWWAERSKMPPLHQVREIHEFLRRLSDRHGALARATDLMREAQDYRRDKKDNPWRQFLAQMLDDWRVESEDAELSVTEALEFLYETCAESRRDFSYGEGINLSTIHAAKGTEHDHVLLLGAWPLDPRRAVQEEARRTLYVGITRARQSLAVFEGHNPRPSLTDVLTGPSVWRREAEAVADDPSLLNLDYALLGLEDLHLGFPAYFEKGHPLHAALESLHPGDKLQLRPDSRGLALVNSRDTCVGRLSQKAATTWGNRLEGIRDLRVFALVHRSADQEEDPALRERYRTDAWEVPLVEIVYQGTPCAF